VRAAWTSDENTITLSATSRATWTSDERAVLLPCPTLHLNVYRTAAV